MELETRIRRHAAELGFGACGFAAAAPIARGPYLEGWLDAGFAGEMRYLARRPDRRLTVAGILPEARSVISLAFPYAPPPAPRVDWRRELRGRIAAYALGADYHRILDRKLARLAAYLAAECPGSRSRRYVDTGAVLEREWAQRGGLGWFGKNTMLLSTRAGSWFFLAELVTTIALAPDAPSDEHCGSCTRCRAECPTQALRDGLTMDARRCISYLTIEHRGAIPPDLRAALGPWVFGCDVCQEVCPWNDGASTSRREALPRVAPWLDGEMVGDEADVSEHAAAAAPERSARERTASAGAAPDWLWPNLRTLVGLDDDGFRARFRGTPLTRAKRRGLVRNAVVALGNTGNPDAVPALVGALADREPLVRGHAAWALGAIGGVAARRALEQCRGREDDPFTVTEIESALAAAH